jgi:xanthine/uracil permease
MRLEVASAYTLIFFVMVGGRVPSYLGSSFSFIAVVIAASGYSGQGPNPGIDIALGGIVAAGVLYAIIALIVMGTGIGWVERLMPPVVTGAVVAVIGLNLAPVAVKAVSGSQFDAWIGLLTVLIIALIAVSTTGLWRRLPIILGAIAGYLSICCWRMDWDGASQSTSARSPRHRGSECRNSRLPAFTPTQCF